MLVYSGDMDGVCATIGTQGWVYNVQNSKVHTLWQPFYVDLDTGDVRTQTPQPFGYDDLSSQTTESVKRHSIQTMVDGKLTESPVTFSRFDLIGYFTKFYNSFTFATIHYAGHEVPLYQAEKSFLMFKLFLNNDNSNTAKNNGNLFISSKPPSADATTTKSKGNELLGVLFVLVAVALLGMGYLGLGRIQSGGSLPLSKQ